METIHKMIQKMSRRPYLIPALVSLLVMFAIAAFVVHAQQSVPGTTPVQQVQPLLSCNNEQTQTSAGNGAAAISITPPANQAVYICSIYIVEVANAAITGAAGPAPIFTTAGLPNNLIWWGDNSTQGTGWQKTVADEVYPWFLRGQTGTVFTLTNSAGQSTQNVRIHVTYFTAP